MTVAMTARTKGLKDNFQCLTHAEFGVLREFSETLPDNELLVQFFETYRGIWSAEVTKEVAKALEKITLKEVAKFKKLSRDEVVKSPIEICKDCAGEGTTELDSQGAPQYINFCMTCKGVGRTRNTYDKGDYLHHSVIERLVTFLTASGGVKLS